MDSTNLVVTTAQSVATSQGLTLPPFRLEMHNEIPLGKGLGSSAAAILAGIGIADFLLDLRWSRGRILDESARMEGHPDNVAAAMLGSIVASAIDGAGTTQAVRIPVPPALALSVVVPDYALPTHKSRAVLPECYSRADSTFNVQRVALLAATLAMGELSALPLALQDRIHQPFRCSLVPGLKEILELQAPGLFGCTLSGAGPAILVFHERGHEEVCELVRNVFGTNGFHAELITAGVCGVGTRITP